MPLYAVNSRSAIADTSGRRWDPEAILKICQDGRCVGWAPSKGRKCRMPIRQDNAHRVESLLADLAAQRPDPERLRPKLERLAEHGLCVRFHQYQVDDMVDRWLRSLDEAFPSDSDEEEEGVGSTSARMRERLGSSNVIAPETLAMQQTIAAMQQALREAERRIEELSNRQTAVTSTTPSASNVSRVSASASSSLRSSSGTVSSPPARRTQPIASRLPTGESATRRAPSTASSQARSPATAETRQRSSGVFSPSAVAPSTGPQISAPSTSSRPSRPTPRCTRSHARRLPSEDECPICQEGDPLSECASSEVAWCRSGCGRSLHKTCLEDWRAQCLVDCRGFACPVCRGGWDEGPKCDACDVVHVNRRKIEGDCAICCYALKGDDVEAGREGLVWCKDSCGQSVHQECFESWKDHRVADGRDATCVSCRAPWRCEESEC